MELYISVHDREVGVIPPNDNDTVPSPAPPIWLLAMVVADFVDQDVPLYNSVHVTLAGVLPLKKSALF
jgi:hypothetical protein